MATENELISIADLIVGLRDSATHARNIATERKSTIDQRDAEIASLNKKLAEEKQDMQDLVAEDDALRKGIVLYRAAFVGGSTPQSEAVVDWETAVGSIILPRAFVSANGREWRSGDVPDVYQSIAEVHWRKEITHNSRPTVSGVISMGGPEIKHRPVNCTWAEAHAKGAGVIGLKDCLVGARRLEDAEIVKLFDLADNDPRSPVTNAYHKAYSEAVEFLRPAAVTVAAVKRADLEGFREHLKPRHEAPDGRPFRFVDPADRPISWTFLDPKMPASGAEPKAAAAEPPPQDSTVHPGAEFRQGLRPKIFEKLTGIVWDDQRTPRFASRPVNSTWAEVQRRAAEILGREDCLAGRARMTTEGVYEAVGMTHEDRAKTDAAAVAYQKAYSAEVAWVREDDVSYSAKISAQQRGAVKWINSSDPMSPFCFVDKNDGLPISWRALDPDMETKHTATVVLRDRDPGPAGTISIEAKRDSFEALIDGSEFRTKRAWSCLPPIPGLVWDHAKYSYEVRPVNMTWGEVHRRAADILGEDDAKAGKERMSKEMIYDALNLTDEDRAKTDVAHISYQKAYSGAVPYLRPGRVSDKAAGAAKKRGAWLCRERRSDDPLAPFMYIDGQGQPIAWRLLDPDMEIVVDGSASGDLPAAVPRQLLTIRGGSPALAMLMQVFVDGPMYCPPKTERGYHEMLCQDGLIVSLDDLGLAINDAGKKVLVDNLKSILATLSSPSR